MPKPADVLALLARADICSGSALGQTLGVSRAAVHKTIALLLAQGVQIESRRGEGYRLDPRFRPLQPGPIPPWRVEVLDEVDSTSRLLLRRADQGEDIHQCVVLAERQTAGVGRRGRSWVCAPYSNLLLSCAWRFERPTAQIAGLSLVVGTALHQVCTEYGVPGLTLKWPNDLVCGQAKLGGILIDVRGESEAPTLVVCGLGLNVYLPETAVAVPDQPWTDLQRLLQAPVDRSRLVRSLLALLYDSFQTFERQGFAPSLREGWERRHRDQGAEVTVLGAGGVIRQGRALGVDPYGGLRLQEADGVRVVYSGDVSLRREFTH